jgi:NAD(P)-dependent dehydrogenase (short-subunit alcohol dehydrogenase family)
MIPQGGIMSRRVSEFAPKELSEPRTVVVTGASAGLGRAIACAFGARGDKVALLARGIDGLEAAAEDVESAGGRALVVQTDVSRCTEVDAAAQGVEAELGPIDVWVNNAMTSVFAPFSDMTPEEFERVTAVNYLGYVYGTMAALNRMRPRDRGTIVQVGSALALRSIPLQSAYCGSKHAILGFTESLRTELLHDHSGVSVTMVQMPAMNTPQFAWVRTKMPNHPQPVAPIYQPEVAALGVLFAADHPNRHNYYVGLSTSLTVLANKVAPGLLDRYLAATGYASQQIPNRPVAPGRPDNLFDPVSGLHSTHGMFDDKAWSHSPQLWITTHKARLAFAAATIAGAAGSGWLFLTRE